MQKNIKVGGSFEIEHKILKYQSKLDDSYRAGNIEKLIFYSNKIKLYKTLKKNVNQQGGAGIASVISRMKKIINETKLTTTQECEKLRNDVHSILKSMEVNTRMDMVPGVDFDSIWNKAKQEVEQMLNNRIKIMIEKRNIMINELIYNMTNLDQPDAIIIREILPLLIPPELTNYLYDNNSENLNKLHKKIIETRSSLRCIKYKDQKECENKKCQWSDNKCKNI